MKDFLELEPEVAGGLGEDAEIDTSTHPPTVHKLHYEMMGWLGDDLLETFPCYIVTEKLKRLIEEMGATGVDFDSVQVTVTEEFRELQPEVILPQFSWLKPVGVAGRDDFGVTRDCRLVVSERLWSAMRGQCRLDYCDHKEF